MDKGKWSWDNTKNRLHFHKTDTVSLRQHKAKCEGNDDDMVGRPIDDSRLITLQDVKDVAVSYINTELIKAMKVDSAVLFDHCYKTTAMDQLLCNVLDYYECHTNYEFTCNMDVSSDIYASDAAQKQLKISSEKFEQAKCNLSSSYITFIAGLDGLEKTHHSMHGKSKSKMLQDRYFYEAIYELTLLVTWITFGYEHWDQIHSLIGSALRTASFNRDVTTPEIPKIDDDGDDDSDIDDDDCTESCSSISSDTRNKRLSWKVYHDRPGAGHLSRIRSPVMEYLYPLTHDKFTNILIPDTKTFSCNYGIIGDPMNKYNLKTLKRLEGNDDDTSTDSEDDETIII